MRLHRRSRLKPIGLVATIVTLYFIVFQRFSSSYPSSDGDSNALNMNKRDSNVELDDRHIEIEPDKPVIQPPVLRDEVEEGVDSNIRKFTGKPFLNGHVSFFFF